MYLQMLAVVLIHNSQKNADKYIHADDDENDKEQTRPWVAIIGRHPARKENFRSDDGK